MAKHILKLQTARSLRKLLSGEAVCVSFTDFSDEKLLEKFVKREFLYTHGTRKKSVFLVGRNKVDLLGTLSNTYGIDDLSNYIGGFEELCNPDYALRSEIIHAGNPEDEKTIATEYGFFINSFSQFEYYLDNEKRLFVPKSCENVYISDPNSFRLAEQSTTFVLIENSEPFHHINKYRYLFKGDNYVFTKRWPLKTHTFFTKWMKKHQHKLIHFGDFDIAGIAIYLNETLGKLKNDCLVEFFIPENIEELLKHKGTNDLYKKQLNGNYDIQELLKRAENDFNVQSLIKLITKHKKVLRQETLAQV